ncbi:MAG: TrkH family potassium uptake protein, partial [Clostridia bacterium]|nr:TrkH family potassium uptake protein [Clostridia bacterium]
DFNLWPEFSKMILVLLMFVGGCAGSTGGGIKVSRIVVMLKTGLKEIRYYLNPREIRAIHFDRQPLERSVITGISSYFVVFMILFAMSVLAISLNGHDFTTSVTAVTACINNIGPGLSKVGPMSNYSCMSTFSKYVLSFDMLLGRLELFPILVLLSPYSWKK